MPITTMDLSAQEQGRLSQDEERSPASKGQNGNINGRQSHASDVIQNEHQFQRAIAAWRGLFRSIRPLGILAYTT